MDNDTFPVGKLPLPLLEKLLGRMRMNDPNVLAGPGIGVDAAVIRFGSETLAFKTDPITFTADNIAWYLITVNANGMEGRGFGWAGAVIGLGCETLACITYPSPSPPTTSPGTSSP
jgi:hypothetical protein